MGNLTIAIDGPSGAGKSTITTRLANKLGIFQLNTGALYRAIGLYYLENNIDVNNTNEVLKHINDIDIKVKYDGIDQITLLNGENVNSKLRTPEVDNICSITSQIPELREHILTIQQEAAKNHSLIIEGRDIGAVVLPNATFKFYLDASPEVRANRRVHDEKNGKNIFDYDKVLADIIERDRRDTQRKISPLVRLPEAIYVNSDNMSIEEVVDYMYNIIVKG